MNKRDRIINHMMLEFAEKVRVKGLRPSGIGGGLNHETGKYKELGITFTMQEKVKDIAEARILFIETANAFMNFINTREDLQEYLDVFPVTILNIDMAIIFSNAQPGDIVDISNCHKRLFYYTAGPDPDKDPWEEIREETYEEALKLVRESSSVVYCHPIERVSLDAMKCLRGELCKVAGSYLFHIWTEAKRISEK